MSKATPEPADPLAPRILAVRKLLARINGARLCYGEPVQAGGRTVIPVARVFAAGGGGFGRGDAMSEIEDPRADDGLGLPGEQGAAPGSGTGGGGGGTVTATPVGFIEVSDTGTRFQALPDPERPVRLLAAAVRALPALLAAVAGVRALRAGAGSEELARVLRRSRPDRRLSSALRRRAPRMLASPRR